MACFRKMFPAHGGIDVRLKVNGREVRCADGVAVIDAVRAAGVDLPSLCHDSRLKPCGSCRLCSVEVSGQAHPVSACIATATTGMDIRTDSPALEAGRRAVLEMQAQDYPDSAVERWPDKPFHRWLRHYGIRGKGPEGAPVDSSHPYIQVDMSRCIHCYRCVRICAEVQGQFIWNVRGRGSEVRIVADSEAPFGHSRCVSCGACVDTCPTGALEDWNVLARPEPETWTRSVCPYCGTGCELEGGVAGGELVRIRPAHDAPVNHGHLCVKGRYAFDYVNSPDRVTWPMIRDIEGQWRRVSMDEAVRHIAKKLTNIRDTAGPDAIGVLGSARATNEENYVAQKFARVALGTNNVDCCARVCHAPTAAAMGAVLGTGAATNSYSDIEIARVIFICGANPTENHPVIGARIRQAALGGARLIVADPHRTELAAMADVHLALRPGTNVALFNAMANVIVDEGLADAAYIQSRVSEWDEFRSFIAEWTPERAESICGVPADLIRKGARLYAAGNPSLSVHGLGLTENIQGTECVMCLVNLALLTGNVGRPGAGVNPLRGQNNVQGAAHMGCEPTHLTGYATLDAGRAKFAQVWGVPLPETTGETLMEMMDAAAAGHLKALWVTGYDIMLTNPDAAATRKALANLELVIVQDLFINETAKEFGTVFLPACSSWEKDGTFMNAERRIQRVRKAIEARGESLADWKPLCMVAEAMGFGREFGFRHEEDIWNEIRRVWAAGAGITYGRLDLEGGLQWPCFDESHPGTGILHERTFSTGDPRAALRRINWIEPEEKVTPEYPLLLTTGRLLYQFNAGTMTMRTGNNSLRPNDTLDLAPADAKRLGVKAGGRVRVISRHGAVEMPVRVEAGVKPGEAFATFHTTAVFLNEVTGPERDNITGTPQYKVVAVRVEAT